MKTGEFRLKLYPKDFEIMRSFYTETLGFAIAKEWNRSEHDRGTMFDVGGTTLELLSPEEGYQQFSGFGLSIEVENVKSLWLTFQDKDFVTHALRHNEWGDTSFQISDPEGLKISLFTKD